MNDWKHTVPSRKRQMDLAYCTKMQAPVQLFFDQAFSLWCPVVPEDTEIAPTYAI